jgi:hypothetical protein
MAAAWSDDHGRAVRVLLWRQKNVNGRIVHDRELLR